MLLLERWTEPLAESNCYLLGEAGRAVVIDPNDPRGPLERLEALGWTPERILLTHEHCDHMAGLEALRNRWPGVWVAATAACSAGLGGHPAQHDPEDGGLSRLAGASRGVLSALRLPAGG